MIATLFVLHFIADFILQSRQMGKKKSVEFIWLFRHLLIQFWIFLIGLALFSSGHYFNIYMFALVNALIHGVIDWNVWRFYKLYAHTRITKDVNAKYKEQLYDGHIMTSEERKACYDERVAAWQYWEDHFFYTTIGFDQMLHMLTLYYVAGWFL